MSATPIYTESTYWRNPQDGSRSVVLVIAVSLDNPGLSIAAIKRHKNQLRLPDTILYDRWARSELGDIQLATRSQLRHTVVTVVGFFTLGSNFSYEAQK